MACRRKLREAENEKEEKKRILKLITTTRKPKRYRRKRRRENNLYDSTEQLPDDDSHYKPHGITLLIEEPVDIADDITIHSTPDIVNNHLPQPTTPPSNIIMLIALSLRH